MNEIYVVKAKFLWEHDPSMREWIFGNHYQSIDEAKAGIAAFIEEEADGQEATLWETDYEVDWDVDLPDVDVAVTATENDDTVFEFSIQRLTRPQVTA